MAPRNDGSIPIEGTRLLFRNFSGRETKYNRQGERNFCVVLPQDLAARLFDEGWNIKSLPPREEGDEIVPYVKVSVSYKGRPPRIVLITSKGRNELPEELISMLDHADIANVDLIVRPYNWEVKGERGVSAYLKSIYITIHEDVFELKYAELEEQGRLGEMD